MKKGYVPNLITGLRLIGVPVLFVLISLHQFIWALVLTLAMALSDAIDGYIAKRFDWQSRFGAFFDPLADKLMSLVAFLTLWSIDKLPLWFALFMLITITLLIIGGIIFYFYADTFCVKPPLISKLNTLIQWILVIFILINYSIVDGLAYSATTIDILMWLIVVCTLGSVYSYTRECRQYMKKRIE